MLLIRLSIIDLRGHLRIILSMFEVYLFDLFVNSSLFIKNADKIFHRKKVGWTDTRLAQFLYECLDPQRTLCSSRSQDLALLLLLYSCILM